MIKIFQDAVNIRPHLIDKSLSEKELSNITMLQWWFGVRNGFIINADAAHSFVKLHKKLYDDNNLFNITSIFSFYPIKYFIWFIYIKLRQWKLRQQARQGR